MNSKRGKIIVKRVSAYLATGFGGLSAVALALGYLLDGRIGLAMMGWGLLFLPVALLACIVIISPGRIARLFGKSRQKVGTFLKGYVAKVGAGLGWQSADQPMHPSSDSGCCRDDVSSDPLSFLGAHYNWSTGKFDGARGPGGFYDPPYDPMKE